MQIDGLCEPDRCNELQRIPEVAGARNLRDLGGYRTRDGRVTRRGLVYRSGSLAELTAEGCAALHALGLRGICDLRTPRERELQPYAWRDGVVLDYWCRDYETSFGELRRLLEAGMTTGDEARAAMFDGYRSLPFEQAPAYRELFRRLATGEVPLLFCCSAGKDRTGVAAALILTALGVPRETVALDYALTDRVIDLEKEIVQRTNGSSSLSRQSVDVVRAILGCHIDYIEAALNAVAPSAVAFNSYLHDTLSVDTFMLESIRTHLLE